MSNRAYGLNLNIDKWIKLQQIKKKYTYINIILHYKREIN